MVTDPNPDDAMLEKLVLGQLSTEEMEQLAAAHAEDERVSNLAESHIARRDPLLGALRQHTCAPRDAALEQLARRLVQRLNGVHLLEALAPAQQPDELGRLGTYRILKVLGVGGMGVVLLADDSSLNRLVAVKVMRREVAADPSARQRFLREARAAAAIDDPHLVPIHQVGEENGMPFIVMPLLEGESLAGRLARERRLPLSEVISIGRQIAKGLAKAVVVAAVPCRRRDSARPHRASAARPGRGHTVLESHGLERAT